MLDHRPVEPGNRLKCHTGKMPVASALAAAWPPPAFSRPSFLRRHRPGLACRAKAWRRLFHDPPRACCSRFSAAAWAGLGGSDDQWRRRHHQPAAPKPDAAFRRSAASTPRQPPSRLEQILSARAGVRLSSSATTSWAWAARSPCRKPARLRTTMSWAPATKWSCRCAARRTAISAPLWTATAVWCCRAWRPIPASGPQLRQFPPGCGCRRASRLCRQHGIHLDRPGAPDQRAGVRRSECSRPASCHRPVFGGGCAAVVERRQENRFAAQCPHPAQRP